MSIHEDGALWPYGRRGPERARLTMQAWLVLLLFGALPLTAVQQRREEASYITELPNGTVAEQHSRRLQVARPKTYFVEVTTGTCEDAGHSAIEDGPECKQAAELWGFKITWGPNGGYHDVVDGCSIRGKESAFLIPPAGCVKGSPTPEWVPGANGKATCTCTDWQPCMCRAATASGWGSAFLLVFTLIGIGYLGGGIAIGSKQGRKPHGTGPAGMFAIHPHYMQWRATAGLISDGIAFARSGGVRNQTGGTGYSSLGPVQAPPVGSPKRLKKSKKQSSRDTEKSQEGGQNISDEKIQDQTEVIDETPVAAPTPVPAQAGKGTTAGDVRSATITSFRGLGSRPFLLTYRDCGAGGALGTCSGLTLLLKSSWPLWFLGKKENGSRGPDGDGTSTGACKACTRAGMSNKHHCHRHIFTAV